MRAVGVKANEWLTAVNEILCQNPGGDRLADAAFFAANEIE